MKKSVIILSLIISILVLNSFSVQAQDPSEIIDRDDPLGMNISPEEISDPEDLKDAGEDYLRKIKFS